MVSAGSVLTKASISVPVMYKSPQLQHQKSSGFTIQGYDTGITANVRSSSRDSGSSSSRTTSRTGSRGGCIPAITTTAGMNKRGRNPIRNRPERIIHLYQENTSPLRNAISKGNEMFNFFSYKSNVKFQVPGVISNKE